MNRNRANLMCLLCAVLWGLGFIATASGLKTFPPFIMMAIRFTGGAALSWIPVFFQKDRLSVDVIKKGIVSGVFLYLAFAFQTVGLAMTDTGMNAFLTSVNVILVPYIAWVCLKQKPSRRVVLASLICLLGIGCLSLSRGSFVLRFGDILSLICAVLFACQIVSLNSVQNENPLLLNTVQLTAAAAMSVPCAVITGGWPSEIGAEALTACIYSIVFSTFICYMLQTTAQKYTSPSSASVLLSTESLWANVFGWVILKEPKSWIMIVGGLLIFTAILIVEFKGRKKMGDNQKVIQITAEPYHSPTDSSSLDEPVLS
ncbi:MAG: DMT family transporter [Erysipelotrichaceae bacterium]|nr:DMT family transporter [Erysipelotrichaceae bacterium]